VYRAGTLARVLPAGRHWLFGSASTVLVDLRERLLTLAPQDVLTSDAVTLRVAVTLRLVVTDPVAYAEKAAAPVAAVYLAAQIALRDNVSGLSAEDVMRRSASCSMPTRRWPSCGWSSRFRTGPGWCWPSGASMPTWRLIRSDRRIRRRGG
jgi:regulator of protease activity HflC (stomatin/prohibitin superfamily)